MVEIKARPFCLEWCINKGLEKILPPSGYSPHGSPLRTPLSSVHGSPQDSVYVSPRPRIDPDQISGILSRRSSDASSPIPTGSIAGTPEHRGRRRSDYSPHQGTFYRRGLEKQPTTPCNQRILNLEKKEKRIWKTIIVISFSPISFLSFENLFSRVFR